MKVLFRNRPNAFSAWGGDTTQMVKTARALQDFGVDIQVCLEAEADLRGVDLVHVFNIQNPKIGASHVRQAKKNGVPVVVSPIFWDMRHLQKLYTSTLRERVRSGLRLVKKGLEVVVGCRPAERHPASLEVEMLGTADALLPNSAAEIEHLAIFFDMPEVRMKSWVVPNGAEYAGPAGSGGPEALRRLPNEFVLVAARIEQIKGQSCLLRGLMERRDIPVVLVGASVGDYAAEVVGLAEQRGNTWIVGHIEQEAMPHFYQRARVHALPSLRESPGLATLEAALYGANCVVSYHCPAFEYFMGRSWFCDPESPTSVGNAVISAWGAERSGVLGDYVRNYLNYRVVARSTLDVYEWVMARVAIGNR